MIQKNFKNSLNSYLKSLLRSSLLIIGWSVILNVSCTSPTNKRDSFREQEGWTIHDIQHFRLPVFMETIETKVGDEEQSARAADEKTEKEPSGKLLKKARWIDAPLTEKHLKELGALRIKTASQGELVKNSTSQEGVFVDSSSSISFINRYYKLDYEFLDVNLPVGTNMEAVKNDPIKLRAFLLGKTKDFYGFPDTVYYILPHLEGNYLIFYRLGKPETIPYDQVPIARKVGDFLATPMIGYPVRYCLPEQDRNRYGEVIERAVPNCEGISIQSAEYVRFQSGEENRHPFQYLEKPDLFSTDFFSGHWLYLKTEIQSNTKRANQINNQPFKTVNLVEFRKRSDYLIAVDSSQYGMEEKDRDQFLFIPVKWQEYETDQDIGVFNSFVEREKAPAKKDTERPYFLLDFQSLKDIDSSMVSGTRTVQNIFITDDFLSFNIEINQKGASPTIIKYAFKRAEKNPDYPEKQWNDKDSTQFHPTSHIKQKRYSKVVNHTKKDSEKFYRIIRFNPNQKEIRWHFSTQTSEDEWVRDFGRQAIDLINAEFQEAGKYSPRKMEVNLDESEDKELGDIRYNILNLMFTETTANSVFGVGSNRTHPITGEIISATANVWVSYIVEQYIHLIRKYIRFHVWPLPWKILPTSPGVSDFLHEKIQKLCPEVVDFIGTHKGVVPPLHPMRSSKEPLNDKELQIQCSRKMARVPILAITLQALRQSLGFRYILSASADKENYYESYDEIEEVFGDLKKRHKVASPIWEDNLTDSHKTPPHYSSVMDYSLEDFPQLSVPGKYDLAATRYLYFDQLEVVDDKGRVEGLITLNSNEKNISESLREGPVLFTSLDSGESVPREIKENQLKKYYVCGGANVYLLGAKLADVTGGDPFCSKWDYGETPKEVVENKIRQMKDSMMLNARRYESSRLDESGIFKRQLTPILPDRKLVWLPDVMEMQKFSVQEVIKKWTKLRSQALDAIGKKLVDFSFFIESDIEEYENIIQKAIQREKDSSLQQMTEEKRQACESQIDGLKNGITKDECEPYSEIEAYYEIVPLLQSFYKELLFIPPKNCIYQQTKGSSTSYKSMALEVIRARVEADYSTHYSGSGSAENRKVLIDCQSEVVKDWAEKNNLGDFIAEVGVFSSPVKYYINPMKEDPLDEFSISMHDRFNAIFADYLRVFFLEPRFGREVIQEVEKLLLEGFDMNPYLDRKALQKALDFPSTGTLPQLPRFTSYEITTIFPLAQSHRINFIRLIHDIRGLVKEVLRKEEATKQLDVHTMLLTEEPSVLLLRLNRLTANSNQAKSQMSTVYGKDWPFILQTYEEYLEEFNTPEKQKDNPFAQFFMNSSSIINLVQVEGDNKLYIPFDSEQSVFAKLFRQYNKYKKCFEGASVDYSCEEEREIEREGYIQLIESALRTGKEETLAD